MEGQRSEDDGSLRKNNQKKEGYDAKKTGNRFQGEKNLRANYGFQVV